MDCQCCGRQAHDLDVQESELLNGMRWAMCKGCIVKNHQPRFVVLMAGRIGRDVREFIVNKRYCGKELTAREITTLGS